MDIKRMFELRMFRLSAPSNRAKVQPVDCILNAKFHIIQSGLASELYKILTRVKKATVDGIIKEMDGYPKEVLWTYFID
ncbi:hypothetical protein COOONC_08108 [Cooperia oncophora]